MSGAVTWRDLERLTWGGGGLAARDGESPTTFFRYYWYSTYPYSSR